MYFRVRTGSFFTLLLMWEMLKTSVSVHVCEHVCVSMLCVYTYACVCQCACVWAHAHVCTHMCELRVCQCACAHEHVCMCVSVCMCEWACAHEHVCVLSCACVEGEQSSLIASHLNFCKSLPEPGWLVQLFLRPWAPGIYLPVSSPQHGDYRHFPLCPVFPWVLGAEPQALLLEQQTNTPITNPYQLRTCWIFLIRKVGED